MVIAIAQFFGPSIVATGGTVHYLFTIPGLLFYIVAYIMELFCYLVASILHMHMHSPFTRIEAIKIARSASFSISKAKEHFGYIPIVSSDEGIERAAVDFKRRFYAAKQKVL